MTASCNNKRKLEIIVSSEKSINCSLECPQLSLNPKGGFTKAWCVMRNSNKDGLMSFDKDGKTSFLRTELCFSIFGND